MIPDNNAKSTDAESVFNVDKINELLHQLNKIYNEGVQACIEAVNKIKDIWVNAEDTPTRYYMIEHYNELIDRFEQLKKPLQ